MKTPKKIAKDYLRNVNRWLKYSGFRLFIGYPVPFVDFDEADREIWSTIGISFCGWSDL